MKKQKIKCSTHIGTREAAVELSEKIIRSFTVTPELGIAMTHCAAMYTQSRRHFGVVCSLSPNAEITLLGKNAIPCVQFVPCTWDSLRDQGANSETVSAFKENDWETLFPLIVACPYGYETEEGVVNFSIAWTTRYADAADVLLALADAIRKDHGRQATQTRPPDSEPEKQAAHDKEHAEQMKRLEDKLFNQGGADLFEYYKANSQERDKYFQTRTIRPPTTPKPPVATKSGKACPCPDPHCSGMRKNARGTKTASSTGKKKQKTPPGVEEEEDKEKDKKASSSPSKKSFAVTFVPKSHEIYGGRKCDMINCDERARGQCPKCKTTAYCGTKCQSAHWASGHKFACGQPPTEPLFGGTGAMAVATALSEVSIKGDLPGAVPPVIPAAQDRPKIKRSNPILFYFFVDAGRRLLLLLLLFLFLASGVLGPSSYRIGTVMSGCSCSRLARFSSSSSASPAPPAKMLFNAFNIATQITK